MSSTIPISDILATSMSIPLSPIAVSSILSLPPFIQVPHATNIRDLGLIPHSPIRPKLLYRSAAIHAADPSALSFLGIKLILDLRTEREVTRDPTPAIPGVTNKWVSGTAAPTPINMSDFLAEGGKTAWVAAYMEMLVTYAPAYEVALRHLLEEGTPMLFHCTAGKDRTGVLAALLLALAGAEKEVIAYDYALTRVGIEPERKMLLQMLKLWNAEWSDETPGMQEFIQIKGEFILGFLEGLEEKHGGVEGYVESVLGFGREDVVSIREVLRGEGNG